MAEEALHNAAAGSLPEPNDGAEERPSLYITVIS